MNEIQTPSLPDIFATKLAELDKADPWRRDALHASDLGATIPGEGCLRQVWLRAHGAQGRPKTPGQQLLLYKAHVFHDLLYRWLQEADLGEWSLAGVEIEAGGEQGDGRLDILLRHKPTGILLVKDLKTMNASGFVFLRQQGQAKPAHVLQVRHYMRVKGAALGQVCYVDREGSGWIYEPPAFGPDESAVIAAWSALHSRCDPLAPMPPPVQPAIDKRDGSVSLPWMCRYHTRTGEPVSCPYLDTEHCQGALPPHERPKEEFVWRKAKVQHR